jgi:transcriptional regulator with XRE-family HTH domain
MDLLEQIKATRIRNGLTQVDMAERLNITQSNYGYLEKRGDKLTIEQLKTIANALGVNYLTLFGDYLEYRKAAAERESLKSEIERLKAELEDTKKTAVAFRTQLEKGQKEVLSSIYEKREELQKIIDNGSAKDYVDWVAKNTILPTIEKIYGVE